MVEIAARIERITLPNGTTRKLKPDDLSRDHCSGVFTSQLLTDYKIKADVYIYRDGEGEDDLIVDLENVHTCVDGKDYSVALTDEEEEDAITEVLLDLKNQAYRDTLPSHLSPVDVDDSDILF